MTNSGNIFSVRERIMQRFLIQSNYRKDYAKQWRISFLKKENFKDRKTTRQSMEQFDWKKQYFYSGADPIKEKIEIMRTKTP